MEQLNENVNMPQEILDNQDQNTPSLADRETKLANTEQENIRRLREKSEQKEREYQHQLNAMKQELENAKKAVQSNINDDDVAEGRHIKELSNQLRQMQEAQQKERQAQQKERQAQMAMMAEMRIKSEMPQIEQIVNEKNVAVLKERYPHLHNSIFNSQDMYERAKIAHTLITEMGIVESSRNEDRIDTNMRKPKSGAQGALQNKYLYDQYDMTPEETRNTYEMARRYAKGQQ
jgi:hypothetical protein